MNVQKKYKRLLSDHVNRWFHQERIDSVSPAISILQFSDIFLKQVERLHLNLWCSEKEFRKNMCEALCTIYISEKRSTPWKGPLSQPLRPYDWTNQQEKEWIDYMQNRLFPYEFWQRVWCQVPQANWETACLSWRDHFEHIATHYLMIPTDMMEDGEDSDCSQSYVEDSD